MLDQYENLKCRYGSRNFLQRIVCGYSRKNRKAIAEIAEYRCNRSEKEYAFKPAAKKNRSVYGQQESKGIKRQPHGAAAFD